MISPEANQIPERHGRTVAGFQRSLARSRCHAKPARVASGGVPEIANSPTIKGVYFIGSGKKGPMTLEHGARQLARMKRLEQVGYDGPLEHAAWQLLKKLQVNGSPDLLLENPET